MKSISNINFSNLVILIAIPFSPAFLINIAAGLSKIKIGGKDINIIEVIVLLISLSNPLYLQISIINCPIVQINPPTQKALKRERNSFVLGEVKWTYCK